MRGLPCIAAGACALGALLLTVGPLGLVALVVELLTQEVTKVGLQEGEVQKNSREQRSASKRDRKQQEAVLLPRAYAEIQMPGAHAARTATDRTADGALSMMLTPLPKLERLMVAKGTALVGGCATAVLAFWACAW